MTDAMRSQSVQWRRFVIRFMTFLRTSSVGMQPLTTAVDIIAAALGSSPAGTWPGRPGRRQWPEVLAIGR